MHPCWGWKVLLTILRKASTASVLLPASCIIIDVLTKPPRNTLQRAPLATGADAQPESDLQILLPDCNGVNTFLPNTPSTTASTVWCLAHTKAGKVLQHTQRTATLLAALHYVTHIHKSLSSENIHCNKPPQSDKQHTQSQRAALAGLTLSLL